MDVYSEVEEFELQLNESAKKFLNEAAKWAYFLSILGYIGIGFIVLVAIFAGAIFTKIGSMMPIEQMGILGSVLGIIMTVVYLMIAAVCFFPIYYLQRFASNLKTALKDNNSETLTNSFEYLKSHYKFIGIFALIILCFYILIIIFISVAAISSGLR